MILNSFLISVIEFRKDLIIVLNIVETFSGVGAQSEALKRAKIPFKVSATVEWELSAIYAYDILHNGPQDLSLYRHHNKGSLLKELAQYNLSSNGKEPMTEKAISALTVGQLKAIYHSLINNNNLVDITSVSADDLDDDIDILTYSFPCQDLSVSARWWNNSSGLDRDSGNRSSLLWEIERLLIEFKEQNKPFPKFLLMENVTAIRSKAHIENFRVWTNFLEDLGYVNQIYDLSATNFGVPQSRKRTYMISVFVGDDLEIEQEVMNYFLSNNLEHIKLSAESINPISDYLRLDYSVKHYLEEAIHATPNFTASREKIFNNNLKLATDSQADNSLIARTITTKQDRNPNSGIIAYDKNPLVEGTRYRNLTPREAFLLMGFTEESFDNLTIKNPSEDVKKAFLTQAKLLKLAGNSIVVNVLCGIFKQMDYINTHILPQDDKESQSLSDFGLEINIL